MVPCGRHSLCCRSPTRPGAPSGRHARVPAGGTGGQVRPGDGPPRAVLVLPQASHPPPRLLPLTRSRFGPGATRVLLLRAEGQGRTSAWCPVSVTWFLSLLSQSGEGLGILTQSLNLTSARPSASEASGPKARLFRGLVQCDRTSSGQRRPRGGSFLLTAPGSPRVPASPSDLGLGTLCGTRGGGSCPHLASSRAKVAS